MWIKRRWRTVRTLPMTHHLGGPLGMDAFLLVDINGERFMNEDVEANRSRTSFRACRRRRPERIFDSKWKDQIKLHGHRPRQRELVRGVGRRRAQRLVRQNAYLRRG